jgi:hypothetical protein
MGDMASRSKRNDSFRYHNSGDGHRETSCHTSVLGQAANGLGQLESLPLVCISLKRPSFSSLLPHRRDDCRDHSDALAVSPCP